MCSYIKYPYMYLPHRRDFFVTTPISLKTPIKLYTLFSNFLVFENSHPHGISNPFSELFRNFLELHKCWKKKWYKLFWNQWILSIAKEGTHSTSGLQLQTNLKEFLLSRWGSSWFCLLPSLHASWNQLFVVFVSHLQQTFDCFSQGKVECTILLQVAKCLEFEILYQPWRSHHPQISVTTNYFEEQFHDLKCYQCKAG